MTIAKALKRFFSNLNGVEPAGTSIADVIANGSSSVSRNNESAIANTVAALDERVESIEESLSGMNELVLNSSTEDSTKKFSVKVDDSGAITATEIV